jgi:hypothetical protein
VIGQSDLLAWYRAMAPVWFDVEPPRRRVLIMLAHGWIIDRVIHRLPRGRLPALDELGPDGRLASLLRDFDPTPETEAWVGIVIAGLRERLHRLTIKGSEQDLRSLFLVPSLAPYARTGPVSARGPRSSPAQEDLAR